VLVYQHPIQTAEAFYLTQAIDPTLENPSVLAQSQAAVLIADILEAALGTEVMDGVLRMGGTRDPESELPPNDVPRSRAYEILLTLAELFVPGANFSGWRYLTPGEKSQLAAPNGLAIRNIDRVRVHNYGFLGINWRVMAPNGHIYIGSQQTGTPWRLDYSPLAVPLNDRSTIVHELMHVFQNRNWGCRMSNGCMPFQALLSFNDYCYAPLSGKPFRDYKLEEEAEMVSDRYRRRSGFGAANSCNNGATLLELEALIPF
jgi:hypothetical protein